MPLAAAPLLSATLRAATAEAHQRLEDGLDLLRPPLERLRFLHVLEGFYGFHHAWEPAVLAHPDLAPLAGGSGRLRGLREDLRALGSDDEAIDRLPDCPDAAALVRFRLQGLGSLYVLEGSALGGQVIARDLAKTAWAPAGGLHYFNPYGPDTGAAWRAFKAVLDTSVDRSDWSQVIAGATATFDLLHDWLTSRRG